MEQRDRRTLRQIFAEPSAADTRWIDVEHLFVGLGGYAEWRGKDHLAVRLNGHTASFRTGNEKASRLDSRDGDEVGRFLRSAGVSADDANPGDR